MLLRNVKLSVLEIEDCMICDQWMDMLNVHHLTLTTVKAQDSLDITPIINCCRNLTDLNCWDGTVDIAAVDSVILQGLHRLVIHTNVVNLSVVLKHCRKLQTFSYYSLSTYINNSLLIDILRLNPMLEDVDISLDDEIIAGLKEYSTVSSICVHR